MKMDTKTGIGVAIAMLACVAIAEPVWIEAERFAQPGGWTIESQFIDQMGSSYLLANGLGTPVSAAVTRVELPRAGRWRLWVRTRDWAPEHHPGCFRIDLDGKPAAPRFGASGKSGWTWEDGGAQDLSGRVEVCLVDLSGYYGRCDVLVFSDDLSWRPPGDAQGIAALREKFGGVSREIKDAGEYDVVVVGGGLAGCFAAVSAARMGARTALIQDRPVLGGNASTEILVPPVGISPGAKRDPREPRETGLIEEAGLPGRQSDDEARYWTSRLTRLVTAEPDLHLFLNTRSTGVEMQPGSSNQIAAALAVEVCGGNRLRFRGRYFVDCTGDGTVGVAAGAVYRHGREARAEFGESMAPETANAHTMGNSIKFFSRDTGAPKTFEAPPWALKFPTCESFGPQRHPPSPFPTLGWQWRIELGGMQDTYLQKEEIRDDLLRLVFGLWSHIKNGCPKLSKAAANYRLEWVGTVSGVRESRRLMGDHIFTERDMVKQTLFPDRVAFGGWGLDDHDSAGFLGTTEPSRHPYDGCVYSLPFRSLYSTNIVNLLMAGRNISASHVGLSTTRVMGTCGLMGEAVGTAAALCANHGVTPRELGQSHIGELQQLLLKGGCYLVDLRNSDPRDLAAAATASASSEAAGAKGSRMKAANVIDGYARMTAEHGSSAWQADGIQPGPHWVELEWPEPKSFNMVHVTFFTRELAPSHFQIEVLVSNAWVQVAAPQQKLRRHVIAIDRTTTVKLRVVLPKPAGVCEIRVYDEPARVVESVKRAVINQAKPDGPDARFPWERPSDAQPGSVKK